MIEGCGYRAALQPNSGVGHDRQFCRRLDDEQTESEAAALLKANIFRVSNAVRR